MSTISTHVLDLSRGRPGSGVQVRLETLEEDGAWLTLTEAATDENGRVKGFLLLNRQIEPGTYRLTFDTAAYFNAQGLQCFYPQVAIVFSIESATEHYHVPLLLSPYGYSTYRGS